MAKDVMDDAIQSVEVLKQKTNPKVNETSTKNSYDLNTLKADAAKGKPIPKWARGGIGHFAGVAGAAPEIINKAVEKYGDQGPNPSPSLTPAGNAVKHTVGQAIDYAKKKGSSALNTGKDMVTLGVELFKAGPMGGNLKPKNKEK